MQPDLSSIFTLRNRSARRNAGGGACRSELRQTVGIGCVCAWLLGIALLAACSTTPPPNCAAQTDIIEYRQRLSQAADEVAYGQGVLWRVDGTDVPPSYVFGTAHSKDPRVTRLAKPIAAAFENAKNLAIEIVHTPEVDSAVERTTKIPGGNVERLVGPERFKQITAAGARYGSQPEALRQFKPWALYLLFSLPPAEVRDSNPALDFVLQESAEERGIQVFSLESIQEQLAIFDDLDPDRQIALLDAALAENWRIDCWWQTLKDVYLARELGVYTLFTEQMPAIEDDVYRVDERNLRMVERMTDQLAEGGVFVAVGALHLPGERGILNLLAGRGYRISRVY
jgi:uncharacterized protein YbaP (TraB family)